MIEATSDLPLKLRAGLVRLFGADRIMNLAKSMLVRVVNLRDIDFRVTHVVEENAHGVVGQVDWLVVTLHEGATDGTIREALEMLGRLDRTLGQARCAASKKLSELEQEFAETNQDSAFPPPHLREVETG